MNIALVGGGKASVTILEQFEHFSGYTVLGIADVREDAPGMQFCREKKLITTNDMMVLATRPDTDLIIELTGISAVREKLRDALRPEQELLSANGAKLMIDLINAHGCENSERAEQLSSRFSAITEQLAGTIKTIDDSFAAINQLIREGNMISINAKIQAAHAGAAGRAFEAVVNGIFNMVNQIQGALESIKGASSQTHAALDEFKAVEEDLRSSFSASDSNGDTRKSEAVVL